MAKLGIITGSSPNDGTGDSLLQGAIKINNNFNEIYAAIGNGTTITNSIGYARTAGIATYAVNAGFATNATYSTSSGFSTYSTVSGFSTVAGYATSTGISTVAQYAYELTGTPNITAGIITATRFVGSGSSLTGIITSVVAGQNVTVTTVGGVVTIGSTASSAVSSQWTSVASGIVTTSNVGIGTTIANSRLQIHNGTLSITGSTGSAGILMGTGIRLNMGSSNNSIYYDAQDLRIDTSSSIRIGDGSRDVFTAVSGEGSQLYYDGSKKLQTISTGVNISGNLGVSGIVTAQNLQVGDIISSGIITANTYYGSGINLIGIVTSIVAGGNISISTASGSVTISASADSRWSQNSTGINTLSNVGIGTTTATYQLTVNNDAYFDDNIILNGRIQIPGNSNIRIGNVNMGSGTSRNISIGDQSLSNLTSGLGHNIALGEFTLYDTTNGQYNIAVGDRAGQKITTGSYNVIIGNYDGNSGNLDSRTANNRVVIADGQGNIKQFIDSNGNVGIKTTVASEALTVAGVVSATSFYGTLNASQLTGVLPVLDGSNLINITASGSGVIIKDDNITVGTAGTINFGSNLSVTFASGIATVSGASSVSIATTAYALAGTPNLNVGVITATSFSGPLTGNVTGNLTGNSTTSGYATTAGISSSVSGTININTTGVITATRFVGSGTSLTNIPAGQLTGVLPALDGSALFGVVASGTGIKIKDDGVLVGTAGTIDFGLGLDVSPVSAGVVTVTSSGGSLQSRAVVTGVTTSIANNGIGNTDIFGFKSYALMKVGLSTAGWLRLYTDSTSRQNDVNRSVGTDPLPGSGVIAEVITTGISTTQIISPFVMGGNMDNPEDIIIYASIKNLSGTTQSITADLTILQLEA